MRVGWKVGSLGFQELNVTLVRLHAHNVPSRHPTRLEQFDLITCTQGQHRAMHSHSHCLGTVVGDHTGIHATGLGWCGARPYLPGTPILS